MPDKDIEPFCNSYIPHKISISYTNATHRTTRETT